MKETKDCRDPTNHGEPDTFKQHYAGTSVAGLYHAYNQPTSENAKPNHPKREPLPMELKSLVDWLKNLKHDRVTALFTVGIFVATAVYAVVASLQWCTMNNQLGQMKRQSDTMQGQLELAERPWLSFNTKIISALKVVPAGATIRLKLTVKNVGHSPAIDPYPFYEGFPMYHGHLGPVEQQRLTCEKHLKDLGATGFAPFNGPLFPEDNPLVWNLDVTFTKDDLDKAAPDKIFSPGIVGCVDYHSTFSMDHLQTPFIYRLIWNPPHPTAGQSLTFPLRDIPMEQLELISYSGSGKIY